MRLEQREGRSIRYGSGYSQVEVVRFASPRPLERLLRVEATLARKVKLPAAAGLGPEGRHIWRWRAELAERFGGAEPCCGVTFVVSSAPGLLAGFALYRSGDSDTLATTVLWMEPDGVWTEAPEAVEARLAVAAAQCHAGPVDRTRLRDWLALLARPIRDRLAFTRSRRWIIPDPAPATRRFVARLQYLVRDAARRHDARRLGELDRALAFASGGHTAGEEMLIERLADAPDSAVVAALHRLPAVRTDGDGIEVRLTGLAIFGPAKDPTGPLASPECPPCKPLSSISTAP
jgi:hypothetical protein